MLLRGVLEQLGQLQRVLADLLHGREQEAVQGDVDHLLQQAAGLEEVAIPALLHEAGQLRARAGVVVAVLRVDAEALLLRGKRSPSGPGGSGPGRTCSTRRYVGGAPGREGAVPRPTPPDLLRCFPCLGKGPGSLWAGATCRLSREELSLARQRERQLEAPFQAAFCRPERGCRRCTGLP